MLTKGALFIPGHVFWADINKKDYRAWHGLGQAYELLDMPQYALHYFQRSTALR